MFGFTNEKIRRAIMDLPGAQDVKSAAVKTRSPASKDDKDSKTRQDDKVNVLLQYLCMTFGGNARQRNSCCMHIYACVCVAGGR
jgi:hypothetical protein